MSRRDDQRLGDVLAAAAAIANHITLVAAAKRLLVIVGAYAVPARRVAAAR